MALSAADIDSFIAAIHGDPALRDRVRAAILSDEFLAVPASIRAIDERIARIDARIAELDARITKIDVRIAELDERIRLLDVAFRERMDAFERRLNHLSGRVGNLEGWQYEARYRDHLMAHLSRYMRKVHAVVPSDFDAVFEAYQQKRMTPAEWADLHRLDVLAEGVALEDGANLILAIELSLTIDESDVARAKRRADILLRSGVDVRPAVGGQTIIGAAQTLADDLGVIVLVDKQDEAA